MSALALHQQFTVCGDVLKRVKVYQYLERMMAQDDDNTQALRAQLWKARATWARVGQVLRNKNTFVSVCRCAVLPGCCTSHSPVWQ
jgi:hypothetical protein